MLEELVSCGILQLYNAVSLEVVYLNFFKFLFAEDSGVFR